MKRRDFLKTTALGVGAAWVGTTPLASLAAEQTTRFSASDIVVLGKTGIHTSRLACGTGTVGYQHHSHQTALGIQGLGDLLWRGYDNGLRFFDTADAYGSHPHVAEALKHVPREKVTIMTKSWAREPDQMRADIDRFRKELNTDYIDLLLMHCLTEENWTEKFRPTMDVLSEMKEKGIIRAHGCSCHKIEALRLAAQSPWVEVILSRINPIGSHMDADPDTVKATLAQGRANGKGIIGMKILGQGDMRTRQDEALKYALSLGILDAFTIGAESPAEQDDLRRRIEAVNA
ncbi:MAG: aldo/keto reductase [Terriglobia bacterium]|jgi:aryl-alcohol dehydrogenase-like predicted oxidoreductase